MTVWVDAQLSPKLAQWLTASLGVEAVHVRELGLLHASDRAIFDAARDAGVAVITKDADFVALVEQRGPPPQILWVTTGNTPNLAVQELLREIWIAASALLAAGTPLIEVTHRKKSVA